ncbi:N-formyl peptide receptor 2-like [Trichosurus vulpecula]|uniref:N-formyl peptide receptor 2-like n=1 Tax=Trichosurus vulpecula TaxID=9337 RepID=UPI00186B2552|nr:N-formyl peptide receptor 2-like [Trichosurus vulpecula]
MMENSSVLPSNASEALWPTYSPPSAIHQAFWITALIIFCLAFVLGITGNGLVIWVAGFRMARTVTTVLFLNLASADFAFTAFLPFIIINAALQPRWPFGWFPCKLISSMAVFNMFASVFLLTFISLDRCVSVLWPVWARNHRTPCRAALGAAGAWTFALAFSVPTFIFRNTDTLDEVTVCFPDFDPWNETGDDDEYYDALTEKRQWSLVLSHFILGFVIPFLIISVCYGLITVRLWSRTKTIKSSRPFKILTAVVSAFFLCWLPHHVVGIIEASTYRHAHLADVLPYLSPFSSSLAFVNSCLNPLLYVFIGRDFRERLFRSLPAALERALSEESAPTATTANSSTSVPSAPDAETQGL